MTGNVPLSVFLLPELMLRVAVGGSTGSGIFEHCNPQKPCVSRTFALRVAEVAADAEFMPTGNNPCMHFSDSLPNFIFSAEKLEELLPLLPSALKPLPLLCFLG